MISGDHYDRARNAVTELSPELGVFILSPRPTAGEPLLQLEVAVGPETGTNMSKTEKVVKAFVGEGLIRQDYGRGGIAGREVPLQYDGSVAASDNSRRLIFGPFGGTILQ